MFACVVAFLLSVPLGPVVAVITAFRRDVIVVEGHRVPKVCWTSKICVLSGFLRKVC